MKIPSTRLRTFTTLALLALLVPLLAACGNAAEEPAAGTTLPTAEIALTPEATEAPTTAPGNTEPSPTTAPTSADGAAPTTAPATPEAPLDQPIKLEHLEFGVVGHLYYTDRERALTLVDIAGFDWIRQQIHWKDIEGPEPGNYAWGDLDNIVNDVNARGKKLLVTIVRSPDFYNPTNGLPEDPVKMGDFVEAMVMRYGDKIQAYEIWNEQNLARENGGRVVIDDAGHYVEILVECYKRIKAVNPNIIVLSGAPSSSGVNDPSAAVADEDYYRAMYSYKDGLIKDHFDAQAVHPGGAANPPDTLWPDNPSGRPGWSDHQTHYFRHIENIRRLMVEEGVGDHQIWITEFGWATPNDSPGYEFGDLLDYETQAEYITRAIEIVYENYRTPEGEPWVGAMFLWNLNFAVLWGAQGQPNHEEASFAILNPDWSPRPAFTELQGLLARIKEEQGRA